MREQMKTEEDRRDNAVKEVGHSINRVCLVTESATVAYSVLFILVGWHILYIRSSSGSKSQRNSSVTMFTAANLVSMFYHFISTANVAVLWKDMSVCQLNLTNQVTYYNVDAVIRLPTYYVNRFLLKWMSSLQKPHPLIGWADVRHRPSLSSWQLTLWFAV